MKTFLLVLFSGLACLPTHGQDDTTRSLPDAVRFIDAWLEAQQAYDRLPGISVGVVRNQELIWSKGYGVADLKKETPATPQTLYSICSITKLFTSIAIMQLYEQGKLRLDDSLATLLPGHHITQQFSDSGPITVRSLLTHSSGLPRESAFPYWSRPDFEFPTKEQVLEKLTEQQTLYPAATYFQYSNLGMILLGEIVEKLSGLPYPVYVKENILKPLRLKNTQGSLPKELLGTQLATGYSSLKRDGTREVVPPFDTKGVQAAAGYCSTVDDLARFASWQFRLLTNGGKEVLRASTLKDMQRVHWVDPDWKIHWGLGFVVFQNGGQTLTGHWGTCPGYRSILLMDPDEKLAFIVLTNAMENPWTYASQMRSILLKGDTEKPVKTTADLDDYAGLYNAQPWRSEKKIIPWYGHLAIIDLPSENPLEEMKLLQHVEGDRFRRIRRGDDLGEEVVFERDEKTGKVTKMWSQSNFMIKIK